MTTNASIGRGSKFSMGATTNSNTLTDIAEVFDITPPNEQTDTIDASHYQSPGKQREFITGLTDPGDVSFDMNFLPGSASETLILTAKTDGLKRAAKITFPAGQTWAFDMLVTGYEPSMPDDDKMTCTVTGKVTGSVTRANPV